MYGQFSLQVRTLQKYSDDDRNRRDKAASDIQRISRGRTARKTAAAIRGERR